MSFNNGVRYGDKSGMGETGLTLFRRRKTTTEQGITLTDSEVSEPGVLVDFLVDNS
jgi:hypothetical protein